MKTDLIKSPYEWINNADDNTKELFELDDILYDISIKIFDYRIKHNINQKQLAQILNVSQSMISKLESGEYNPTIEQLWKISKKLNFVFNINFNECELEEKASELWSDECALTKKPIADAEVGILAC